MHASARAVGPRVVFVLALAACLHLATTNANALSHRTLIAPTGESPGDGLGGRASVARDIDGDGYTELMLGVPGHDALGTSTGRVYIFRGGSRADVVPDLVLTGVAAGDAFGNSLGSAGDFNGDGYEDFLIGANLNDAGGTDAGRVYLYRGGPGVDTVPDLAFTGEAAGDWFGTSAGTAGDFNGDGFADVIVGAPWNGAAGAQAGRAYVFLGGPDADAVADLTLTGAAAGDYFGLAVGTAGDVNGDGFDDVIVGAYGNDTGVSGAGRAYVYFGGPAADSLADLVFTGSGTQDALGYSVGAAGDVNGDGYADVVVGAPMIYAPSPNPGKAYVFFGGPAADAVADRTFVGAASGDYFGEQVENAGDVNGDGFPDLIVGAQLNDAGAGNAGRAYVFLGGPGADEVADLIITGSTGSDWLGAEVGAAGDFDADGFADIVVGMPGSDFAGDNAGRALVIAIYPYQVLSPNGGEQWVAGRSATVRWRGHDPADLAISTNGGSSWLTLASGIGGAEENAYTLTAPGTPTEYAKVRLSYAGQTAKRSTSDASDGVFRIVAPHDPPAAAIREARVFHGESWSDDFGYAVAGVGDLDGDGYGDVAIGSELYDDLGVQRSNVRVHFGGPGAGVRADLNLTAEVVNDYFGASLAGAGDFDGDGHADLIVGAYWDDTGGQDAGRAYVYLGGAEMASIPALRLTGAAAGDNFGCSVAGAGDFNADGFEDVLVGAPGNDAGGAGAGRAYLYYGGPGADEVADLVFTGEAAGDAFGFKVAGLGDFDGDGHADLAIGAPSHDAAGTNSGRVYVYFGGPGADAVADLVLSGGWPLGWFGSALAAAGDVDGDGHGDLLVGEYGNMAPGPQPGRAYLFLGGPGADDRPDLTLTGENDNDEFGLSVAGAGDLNSDGYADIVLGAPAVDVAAGPNAGKAYVYFGGPGADPLADFVLAGPDTFASFGFAVAGAGDVDGDGVADLLVGVPGEDGPGGSRVGAARLYTCGRYFLTAPNGGETWLAGSSHEVRWLGAEPADLWLSADGGASYALLESDVGGAASNVRTLIVPDLPTTAARVRLTPHDPTVSGGDASDGVFRIVAPVNPPGAAVRPGAPWPGAAAGDYFGGCVSGIGDFNGDGHADVVVGARGNDTGGADAGRAYIHRGGPGADAVADLILTGEAAGDLFGKAVARAGDVNGDGCADVIVGAEGSDAGGAGSGRAYVYFGGPGADASPDLVLTGAGGDVLGSAVAGAGDFNGDGYDDLLVGAPFNDTGGTDAGRALLYFGGPAADGVADVVVSGAAAGDRTGSAVAGVGDVNGDGFDDVIVGAYLSDASPAAADAGRAYVCFGGATPDGVPDLVLTGDALGDNLGVSVAGAGDVNGDGYDDFVVGAWAGGLGVQQGPGEAYVYFGGPTLDAEPDLTLSGAARYDLFGGSVGAAGDVNGDGYGDLVVGAYNNDAAGSNAGSASVFLGGPAPDGEADWVFTGKAADDGFGWAVAGAGNFDGEGFDDVLVGAPLNDAAGSNAGAAYLFGFSRYFVTAPAAGETWNVGGTRTVRWQGAEPADLWLSVDGGASYALLASGLGGAADNSHALRVPHTPTRFARVRLTPHDGAVSGAGVSDSLFTIQTSVALLAFSVAPAADGGAELTWSTEPGVGPQGLAGWRLYRRAAGEPGTGRRIGPELITEPRYVDGAATPGCSWRLAAVNGLGEELELGSVAMAELITGLTAWPSPLGRGGALTVAFAAPLGAAGAPVSDLDVGVFDVSGRRVATLARGQLAVPRDGAQRLTWAGGAAPGIYFVRVSAPSAGLRLERKVVLLP